MNKVIAIEPIYKEEYNGFMIEQDPEYPIGSMFSLVATRIDDPETTFVDKALIDLRTTIDTFNHEHDYIYDDSNT